MSSKKDYVTVAAIIKSELDSAGDARTFRRNDPDEYTTISFTMRRVAEAFASKFAADNPAFKRATFLAACGLRE